MKRVLLTGASGFIGWHSLASLLASGYEIHAISLHPPRKKLPDIAWYQVNLLDLDQASELVAQIRPTHLLHFAWYSTPGKYWTSLENVQWIQASLNLMRSFAQSGGQRLVMAGSCAEYDWQSGYCSEAVTALAPTTLYGVSKHSLQLILAAFAKQTGLSSAWGRLFFLFGPREHPDRLVAYVVRSLIQGETARCSAGHQIRDFLYVQDAAEAFVALLESTVLGPVNIASGKPVIVRDLINKIGEVQNRPDLIQLGAVPLRADEPHFLVANVNRLTTEVGWSPKYDLTQGLEQTVKWWRDQSVEEERNTSE